MNNKQKRERNAQAAMHALAHWGHLTARQLSHFVWPNSDADSALNQAYVLVRHLVQGGYLLERIRPDGLKAYVLTRHGAAVYNVETTSLYGAAGYDLGLNLAYGHDDLVEYALHLQQQEWKVVGPHAIRHGHPDLEVFSAKVQAVLKKRVDMLVEDPDGESHAVLSLRRFDTNSRKRFDAVDAYLPVLMVCSPALERQFLKYRKKRDEEAKEKEVIILPPIIPRAM